VAFYQLLNNHPEYIKTSNGTSSVKLVLVGGSRNEGDARRVEDLKSLVKELGIDVGLFHINIHTLTNRYYL